MEKKQQQKQSLSIGKISTAALVAGTGLGFGASADAAIVSGNIDMTLVPWGETLSFTFDVNSDGVDDFTFNATFSPQGYDPGYYGPGYTDPYTGNYYPGNYYFGTPIPHFGSSNVVAEGTNQLTGPYPLAAGESIDGARADWNGSSNIGCVDYYLDCGNWQVGENGYMGLQFDIGGLTHYGWIRLESGFTVDLAFFDFAYEDVANTAIATSAVPIPAMAPLFTAAIGAMGVMGFRRKKREARLNEEASSSS